MKGRFLMIVGVTLVLSVLIGWLLLALVYMIPTGGSISKHAEESYEIMENMGDAPALYGHEELRLSLSQGFSLKTLLLNNRGFAYDMTSDRIMINTGAESAGSSPWITSLTVGNYARYWHGYLITLKPLLTIFNYSGIRIFNTVVMSLMLIGILYILYKRGEKALGFAFLFAVLMIAPPTIPWCMQYSGMSYITLGVVLVILLDTHRMIDNSYRLGWIFLLTGILTSYIDLLSSPLITFGVPMVLIYYLDCVHTDKEKIRMIVGNGFLWGIGYAVMWAGKWILATLVLRQNIIMDAVQNITYRTSNHMDPDNSGAKIGKLQAIMSNLCNYTNVFFLLIIISFVGIMLFLLIKYRNKSRIMSIKSLGYWLLIISPLVWYALLPNHSYIHGMFSYRSLMISWFAGACWLISLCDFSHKDSKAA